MWLNYNYHDESGVITGALDANVQDALDLFARFRGSSAVMYLVLSETSAAVWHKHRPHMFEVRLFDHLERRRRVAQVPNGLAEDCIRQAFSGTLHLEDLESTAFLYSSSAWDPSRDLDYWSGRSRSWPRRVEPWRSA
jgi:hypothetical protein